jgi:hypothetical protein
MKINALNMIEGIGLIFIGICLIAVQTKNLINGKPNTLGGISGLLIIGIGCVVCGIIQLVKR